MGVALAASHPQTVYVLCDNHAVARAAEENEQDSYGRRQREVKVGAEVYRSDDGGATWTRTATDDRQLRRLFATYGWVFGQIRVDPNDPETIYVLGVPLLKSTDGGKTFSSLNFAGLHGDHHAFWINPANSQHLVSGNDGGVNLSYDGGKSWKNLENLPCVQFYNVAIDGAKPFNVYGSIQDNMSWKGPSNHRPGRSPESNWTMVPGGEASYLAVDPEDANTFYSESFYGSLQRSTFEPRETKSIVSETGGGRAFLSRAVARAVHPLASQFAGHLPRHESRFSLDESRGALGADQSGLDRFPPRSTGEHFVCDDHVAFGITQEIRFALCGDR